MLYTCYLMVTSRHRIVILMKFTTELPWKCRYLNLCWNKPFHTVSRFNTFILTCTLTANNLFLDYKTNDLNTRMPVAFCMSFPVSIINWTINYTKCMPPKPLLCLVSPFYVPYVQINFHPFSVCYDFKLQNFYIGSQYPK